MSSERNGTPAEGPADEAAPRRVRDFLVDQGVPEAEVAQAFEDDVVHLLVADRMVLPETPRFSMLEVSESARQRFEQRVRGSGRG